MEDFDVYDCYDGYNSGPFDVFVVCEMSTLKCDKFDFAKFLHEYSDDIQNINDSLWVIRNYRVPDIPFWSMVETLLDDFIEKGLATKVTNLITIIPKSFHGRFCGLEDLLMGQ